MISKILAGVVFVLLIFSGIQTYRLQSVENDNKNLMSKIMEYEKVIEAKNNTISGMKDQLSTTVVSFKEYKNKMEEANIIFSDSKCVDTSTINGRIDDETSKKVIDALNNAVNCLDTGVCQIKSSSN